MLLEHEASESARLEALRNATSIGIMELESDQFDAVTVEDLEAYCENLGQLASEKE